MRPRHNGGFTLPEILVTLAISSVLLTFLFQFFVAQQRTYVVQDQLSDAQQSARVLVEEFTRFAASLGAGVELERGQVRLLVAHPHQLVFNADLRTDRSAMPPGAAVPGATPTDRHATFPAGTYSTSSSAETYRFTLDRSGDNRVDAADRTQGEHYSLYREVNGGDLQEVASLLANPRVGEPLFRYWGDFDGDGTVEVADRVDRTTSSRIAAGETLDAVVRKIEMNVITETEGADPRYPQNGGYRQVRVATRVSPENLAGKAAPRLPEQLCFYRLRRYVPTSSVWARIFPCIAFSSRSVLGICRSGSVVLKA